MRCQDLMRRPVQCASRTDTVDIVSRRMRDNNIGILPVCEPSGRVAGVVTDRDLVVRVLAAARDPAVTELGEIMSGDVVACRPTDELVIAQSLMSLHHKSRVLVTDDTGRPVGVISLADLAQAEPSGAAQTLRAVSEREVLDTAGRLA